MFIIRSALPKTAASAATAMVVLNRVSAVDCISNALGLSLRVDGEPSPRS